MPVLLIYLIIAVALVALLLSEKTRKPALAVIIVLAVSGIIFYEYKNKKSEVTQKLLSIDKLKLQDIQFRKVKDGEYEINGRIYNQSPNYVLKQLGVKYLLRDCKKDQAVKQCTIIGEMDKKINVTVPPQQARDFKESILTHGMVILPKGKLTWDYTIQSTKATQKQ
jgi:hypothetical protein